MVTWLAASKIMNCRPDTRMVLMTSMVYQAATKILIVSLSERAPVSLVEILELFEPELAVRQDLEPSLSQRLQGPFFQWGGPLARRRRLLHRWRRSSLLRRWRGLLYQRRLSQLHRRINAGICSPFCWRRQNFSTLQYRWSSLRASSLNASTGNAGGQESVHKICKTNYISSCLSQTNLKTYTGRREWVCTCLHPRNNNISNTFDWKHCIAPTAKLREVNVEKCEMIRRHVL